MGHATAKLNAPLDAFGDPTQDERHTHDTDDSGRDLLGVTSRNGKIRTLREIRRLWRCRVEVHPSLLSEKAASLPDGLGADSTLWAHPPDMHEKENRNKQVRYDESYKLGHHVDILLGG